MNMSKLTYPSVRRDEEFREKIHDVQVPDPYRWLENNEDKEVKNFCQEQQNLSMSYLQDAANRDDIKKKLTDLFDYPKKNCPFKRGDYYYMLQNTGLQNQHVMYRFKNLSDQHEVFLDPNTFSEDGTVSLSDYEFSKDAKWFAYQISISGSDWNTIRIRNVDTKEDLSDKIEHVEFSNIAWTHDNLGFFYTKYEKKNNVLTETDANQDQKLYYHRINTNQSEDILVYDMPENPKYMIDSFVSDCGKVLHLLINQSCRDHIWYYVKLDENLPIQKRFNTVYPIIEKFEAEFEYLTNTNNLVYFKTNKNAPNFKICRLDLNCAEPGNSKSWVDIIPEDNEAVLDSAICVDDNKIAVIYLKDVVNQIEIRKLEDGKLFKKLDIHIGTITSFSGKRELHEIFFYITSFLSPGVIYHYDFESDDDLKVFLEIKVKDFDANDFVTKQVFFESKDGQVNVPMFITHRKDIELNSNNPCLLYGYGGFQISITPYFSASRLLFMKNFKGIYAAANIRGGNEYGTSWYKSACKLNKQKSYDDFIQAGEYLVENGYTSKDKLIIEGGSNGGLLVSVCSNQRPDLFAASIVHVGVLDLLRFHKFTIGSAWTCDYGDHEEEGANGFLNFKNQFKLSPLHNVPKHCSKYPATLLMTSDHDDRVVPLHSFKYAAELQHSLGKKVDSPLLLRVEMKSGHGQGKSTEKMLEESTDVLCFVQKTLNLKFYD